MKHLGLQAAFCILSFVALGSCTSMQVRPYLQREVTPGQVTSKISKIIDCRGDELVYDESGARLDEASGVYVVTGRLENGSELRVPFDSVAEVFVEEEHTSASRTGALVLAAVVGVIVYVLASLFSGLSTI